MARLPDPAVRLRWKTLIERHAASGLSVTEFCDSHDVSTASFYLWRRRLTDEPAAGPTFLPVRLSQNAGSASAVRIRFDCGVVAEIPANDQQSLVAVIDRLLATEEQASR